MLTVWSPVDKEGSLLTYDGLPNTCCKVRAEVLCSKEYKHNEYVPVIKIRLVVARAQYAKGSLIRCQ